MPFQSRWWPHLSQGLAPPNGQLRDLFRAARFDIRPRDPSRPGSGPASIDEWVAAFKARRAQIDNRRCDQP
jgi:hypothetical protein